MQYTVVMSRGDHVILRLPPPQLSAARHGSMTPRLPRWREVKSKKQEVRDQAADE